MAPHVTNADLTHLCLALPDDVAVLRDNDVSSRRCLMICRVWFKALWEMIRASMLQLGYRWSCHLKHVVACSRVTVEAHEFRPILSLTRFHFDRWLCAAGSLKGCAAVKAMCIRVRNLCIACTQEGIRQCINSIAVSPAHTRCNLGSSQGVM